MERKTPPKHTKIASSSISSPNCPYFDPLCEIHHGIHITQYPGVNLPLLHLRQRGRVGVDFYRHDSFQGARGSLSELIQVREGFMMILMNHLTEKPNWHQKVFDETIVAKWRTEALSQSEKDVFIEITGEKNCIAELRCKAAHFKEMGFVFAFNISQTTPDGQIFNAIIKSDSLVSDELRDGFKSAFETLRAEQGDEPDWHPNSDDIVQDLVHPSLYPLVYDKTSFIQDEVVGVADTIDKYSGKGEPVESNFAGDNRDSADLNTEYWSDTYQWLPANLAFQNDGTVRFTSYINNLHPKKHPEIYRLIEKLIDTAIPAWDLVLSGKAVTASGKDQERIPLPPPVDRYDDDDDDCWEAFDPEVLAAHEVKHGPVEYHPFDLEYNIQLEDEEKDEEERAITDRLAQAERLTQKLKWKKIRDPILPDVNEFEPVTYTVEQSLRERFKNTGLQVIVKMASVELDPESEMPYLPPGGWHIEGQMNEHIVATALYYVDSENVMPTQLSFRMATSQEQEMLQRRLGQDSYHSYERIYGTRLSYGEDNEALQYYGSVATPEGRLLAFPNVFQHRVSDFALDDPDKPGHRRFIALWLVDPLRRIVSTPNVPPQQFDWWAEAVFGSEDKANTGELPPELVHLLLEQGADKAIKPSEELLKSLESRLPTEVMEMVRRERVVPEGLMTVEEAREHRLALMEERSAFVKGDGEEWTDAYYNFCEH